MARVDLILDDVVLALKKGKKVEADEGKKGSLNIPATMSNTEKRRNLKLDLSEEGEKLLEEAFTERDKALENSKLEYEEGLKRLKEEKEKSEQNAWKNLNRIADKVEEMRPGRRKKAEKEEAQNVDSDDSQSDNASTPEHSDHMNTAPQSNFDSTPQWNQPGY